MRSQKPEVRSQIQKLRICGVPFLLLASCFCLLVPAFGQTKVFLRSGISPITSGACSPALTCYQANATQGTAATSKGVNSLAGPLTGHYFQHPTLTYTITDASTKRVIWISAPLASGVTVAGTITPNLRGLESAAQCNCGARYEVLRWSVLAGGIVASLGISTDNGVTEWGTSEAARTAPTLTPASTAFAAGDRIVIIVYNDDGNGVTQASGRTWSLFFNGAAGASGDTYLSFTETISFASDTNNARAVPLSARHLLPHLLAVWREYWEAALV